MGISYRFSMFIVIYPFLHILAGVGFISAYSFLSSKNRFRNFSPITKLIFVIIIFAILLKGIVLSLNSENSNKKSFQEICSGLDYYLANLPKGEIRKISDDEGYLSTWFSYYFSKRRIEDHCPYLAKSLRRFGARPLTPPIVTAMEPKLANPHRA